MCYCESTAALQALWPGGYGAPWKQSSVIVGHSIGWRELKRGFGTKGIGQGANQEVDTAKRIKVLTESECCSARLAVVAFKQVTHSELPFWAWDEWAREEESTSGLLALM